MTGLPDPTDPLFKPLTLEQAAAITGRSQRTIRRWIDEKRLSTIELENPREVVLIERDVVEVEKANRDAFARGRPPRAKPDEAA